MYTYLMLDTLQITVITLKTLETPNTGVDGGRSVDLWRWTTCRSGALLYGRQTDDKSQLPQVASKRFDGDA